MEATITIINRHTTSVPHDAIYVGRPSPLGNPFVLGRDGDGAAVIASVRSRWLWQQIQAGQQGKDNAAWRELQRLAHNVQQHGTRTLVCWCKPLACHADIIAAALRWEGMQIRR